MVLLDQDPCKINYGLVAVGGRTIQLEIGCLDCKMFSNSTKLLQLLDLGRLPKELATECCY